MSRGLFPDVDLKRALAEKVFGRAKPKPHPTPSDVGPAIGQLEHCWCGQPQNHDWPGKKDGYPHPRYPD